MVMVSIVLMLALSQFVNEFHHPMRFVPSVQVREIKNPEKDKLDASVEFDESLGVYKIRFKYKHAKTWETLTMERRNQIDLTLKCSIERNQSKYIFVYHFYLGPNSKQKLVKMRVQNFSPVREFSLSQKDWFSINLDENSTGLYFKNGSAWNLMGRALVVNGQKPFGMPGDSGEIQMESDGLPCLVECQAEGRERAELKRKDTTRSWGRDDLPLIVGEVFKNLTPATWGVNGKTLGPGPLPPQKDLGLLLGHVIDELDECHTLGWIKGDDTLKQIRNDLKQVTTSISKGKKPDAKVQGENLIHALESMQNKTISCEVYALVRYNLEYALSKM